MSKPFVNSVVFMGSVHNIKKFETPSGNGIKFNIRIFEKFNDKEYVMFQECSSVGSKADVLLRNLKDGEYIYLEGALRKSRDNDGNERSAVHIIDFRFLGIDGGAA